MWCGATFDRCKERHGDSQMAVEFYCKPTSYKVINIIWTEKQQNSDDLMNIIWTHKIWSNLPEGCWMILCLNDFQLVQPKGRQPTDWRHTEKAYWRHGRTATRTRIRDEAHGHGIAVAGISFLANEIRILRCQGHLQEGLQWKESKKNITIKYRWTNELRNKKSKEEIIFKRLKNRMTKWWMQKGFLSNGNIKSFI